MAGGPTDAVTAALVDRQMRNWEFARSQRISTPRTRLREVEDFICVSRMVGVGNAVAIRLGERLAWPVFDKQILDAMAGDDRRMRLIYESMDERDVGWWQDVLHPLVQGRFSRNDYFHRLCRTVLSLARQSPGVFVGRGIDRVLPRDSGFRVRLIASREERVRWFARDHGLEAVAARREIDRIEAERTIFLRHHFGVEAADPLRHDLIVRVDRMPLEKTVEAIVRARECFRPGG